MIPAHRARTRTRTHTHTHRALTHTATYLAQAPVAGLELFRDSSAEHRRHVSGQYHGVVFGATSQVPRLAVANGNGGGTSAVGQVVTTNTSSCKSGKHAKTKTWQTQD
jgi:hypothetical protein